MNFISDKEYRLFQHLEAKRVKTQLRQQADSRDRFMKDLNQQGQFKAEDRTRFMTNLFGK